MPIAAIYTRISKDVRDNHLGVERQEALCRELAERQGLTVAEVLVDNDVSAYRTVRRRPAFERLVGLLEHRSVDAVVTYHCDRLYRRTTDLERLVAIIEGSKASIHTYAAGDVDLSTASGRMVARMLGAAAQHESERLGERVKLKHDELAARGEAPGGRPPFGYRRRDAAGGPYVVNEAEAEVVRRIAGRILEGASCLRVARELTADGIPTREGRPWHSTTVRAVVVNPAVTALRVHRREVAGAGNWEPILDRTTWEQVCAVLKDPARKRARAPHRYLLSGLVYTCEGDPMIGGPRTLGGGRSDRGYGTRSAVGGSTREHRPPVLSMQISADQLEEVVIEAVLTALDNSSLPEIGDTDDAGGDAGAEIEAIEQEIEEMARLRGEGKITLAEWLALREPAQERLEAARRAAGAVRQTPRVVQDLSRPGAARAAWPKLDFDERRAVLSAVIEKVVIGPATRGRWTPIEDRLDPDRGFGIHWRA